MTEYVLVVVDDPDIREVVLLYVADEGYGGGQGRTGMRQAHVPRERPVLALLYGQVPALQAWGVLLRIQDAGIELPVAFVSAAANVRDEARMRQAVGDRPESLNPSENPRASGASWARRHPENGGVGVQGAQAGRARLGAMGTDLGRWLR